MNDGLVIPQVIFRATIPSLCSSKRDSKMITENGVVVGNVYDKYSSTNFLARCLFRKFLKNVIEMVKWTNCSDIHEIGCGEGHLSAILSQIPNTSVRASDFSTKIIREATKNYPSIIFQVRDIYNLDQIHDSACLIVCCEVLEHLKDPEKVLNVLPKISKEYVLLSVPREPIWRAMNIARGNYLKQLGNTPGHIQHWSKSAFLKMLSKRFEIIDVRVPLPWTIVLCKAREL